MRSQMEDLLASVNSANPTLHAFFLHLSGVKIVAGGGGHR